MKLRRKSRFQAEVSTSSLNDIMFFLLLFFLIVSTITNTSAIKLLLPQAKAADKLNKKQVTLSITADKKFFIDNKEVATQNLESELLVVMQGVAEPTIVVRAENTLTIQDLVDVLQTGAKLKIKMVLATKQPSA